MQLSMRLALKSPNVFRRLIYLSENINLMGWSSFVLPKTGTIWESVQTSELSQDRNV